MPVRFEHRLSAPCWPLGFTILPFPQGRLHAIRLASSAKELSSVRLSCYQRSRTNGPVWPIRQLLVYGRQGKGTSCLVESES